MLGVLMCLTAVAFVATRVVAHSNESLRRQQAAAWFTEAERASRRGETEAAVVGLRRAVSTNPGSKQYRLALAQALLSGGVSSEAERVLLALREAEPEDPEANLSLARLEARGTDTDAARRYYQYAVAGLWRPEHAVERQRVRLELVDFLLARGERARALSELLLVATQLPPDPDEGTRVGRMFLAAGDPRAALDHFVRALRVHPTSTDALAGAGQAAFELGDYVRALRYLGAVPDETRRLDGLTATARLILELDPLGPRLRGAERIRRLRSLLGHAAERLNACPSGGSPQELGSELATFRGTLEPRRRGDAGEVIDDGLDLVYRIQRATEQTCAIPPTSRDRAVLLIARRHGLGDQ